MSALVVALVLVVAGLAHGVWREARWQARWRRRTPLEHAQQAIARGREQRRARVHAAAWGAVTWLLLAAALLTSLWLAAP